MATAIGLLLFLVPLATVTATKFVFFSVATLSPIRLLLGGIAVAGLCLGGVLLLRATVKKLRNRVARQVEAQARAAVFGTRLAPGAGSLLNDLQAGVIRAGNTRL